MKAATNPGDRSGGEWFACYTRGRHEKRVGQLLEGRGFEVFLPLISRRRRWHDREKVVEFPLFPSYVFTRCEVEDLGEALTTAGIVKVVRFAGKPAAIPDEEIESIRLLAEGFTPGAPEPELGPLLSQGQRIRITSGPLTGVQDTVAGQRGRRRLIVIVGVSAIRQGLRVEVDLARVRPIDV